MLALQSGKYSLIKPCLFLLNSKGKKIVIVHRTGGNEMLAFRSATLLAMFLASATIAQAEEFPKAPPRQQDAEAQELHRMSTAELKTVLLGDVEIKGTSGKRKKTFKADGSVVRSGYGQKEGSTGTWRFDEKANAYCNTFTGKKGTEEGCFAVFRTSDGTHYFDYEVDTGFFAHTWRRVTDE